MDLRGGATKELQRVAVSAKEVFYALQEAELEVDHAAVAEHHHEEERRRRVAPR